MSQGPRRKIVRVAPKGHQITAQPVQNDNPAQEQPAQTLAATTAEAPAPTLAPAPTPLAEAPAPIGMLAPVPPETVQKFKFGFDEDVPAALADRALADPRPPAAMMTDARARAAVEPAAATQKTREERKPARDNLSPLREAIRAMEELRESIETDRNMKPTTIDDLKAYDLTCGNELAEASREKITLDKDVKEKQDTIAALQTKVENPTVLATDRTKAGTLLREAKTKLAHLQAKQEVSTNMVKYWRGAKETSESHIKAIEEVRAARDATLAEAETSINAIVKEYDRAKDDLQAAGYSSNAAEATSRKLEIDADYLAARMSCEAHYNQMFTQEILRKAAKTVDIGNSLDTATKKLELLGIANELSTEALYKIEEEKIARLTEIEAIYAQLRGEVGATIEANEPALREAWVKYNTTMLNEAIGQAQEDALSAGMEYTSAKKFKALQEQIAAAGPGTPLQAVRDAGVLVKDFEQFKADLDLRRAGAAFEEAKAKFGINPGVVGKAEIEAKRPAHLDNFTFTGEGEKPNIGRHNLSQRRSTMDFDAHGKPVDRDSRTTRDDRIVKASPFQRPLPPAGPRSTPPKLPTVSTSAPVETMQLVRSGSELNIPEETLVTLKAMCQKMSKDVLMNGLEQLKDGKTLTLNYNSNGKPQSIVLAPEFFDTLSQMAHERTTKAAVGTSHKPLALEGPSHAARVPAEHRTPEGVKSPAARVRAEHRTSVMASLTLPRSPSVSHAETQAQRKAAAAVKKDGGIA